MNNFSIFCLFCLTVFVFTVTPDTQAAIAQGSPKKWSTAWSLAADPSRLSSNNKLPDSYDKYLKPSEKLKPKSTYKGPSPYSKSCTCHLGKCKCYEVMHPY